MSYIPPEVVARAREMDLLTYLQRYEPQELVKFSGSTWCTKTHDSLKISNGKWCWFSRGIGGKSALDYLIKVEGVPFQEAVERITGQAAEMPSFSMPAPKKEPPKAFRLPPASPDASRAVDYLLGRGIDREILSYCLKTGRLYESLPYHNAVFVGMDRYGKPRYASLRGTNSDFKGEAEGSDKRFSFSIPAPGSETLQLFESAIDLLSYATLARREGLPWHKGHLLSLAGVYQPKKEAAKTRLPAALKQYLSDHPEIRVIVLRLDNDRAGRMAAEGIRAALPETYTVAAYFPSRGKDYNDLLCLQKRLPTRRARARPAER